MFQHILLIPFTRAGFALVFFLTFLNLTVSQGTTNGLIFYVNIVKANQAVFFPPGDTNMLLKYPDSFHLTDKPGPGHWDMFCWWFEWLLENMVTVCVPCLYLEVIRFPYWSHCSCYPILNSFILSLHHLCSHSWLILMVLESCVVIQWQHICNCWCGGNGESVQETFPLDSWEHIYPKPNIAVINNHVYSSKWRQSGNSCLHSSGDCICPVCCHSVLPCPEERVEATHTKVVFEVWSKQKSKLKGHSETSNQQEVIRQPTHSDRILQELREPLLTN